MRWPTPPTGPDGAGITNIAPRPATTPATEFGSHDQRSTTAVLTGLHPSPTSRVIVAGFTTGLRSAGDGARRPVVDRGWRWLAAGAVPPDRSRHDATAHRRRGRRRTRG